MLEDRLPGEAIKVDPFENNGFATKIGDAVIDAHLLRPNSMAFEAEVVISRDQHLMPMWLRSEPSGEIIKLRQ